MKRTLAYSWIAAMLFGAGMCWASAHEGHEPSGTNQERLGQVSFLVSCNASAQGEFNRAMALFHSFWFNPAIASFEKVLQLDPECGMANWGIAFMSMGNPFAWPANQRAMMAAAAAIGEAKRVGAKTQREHDYITALDTYFRIGKPPITGRAPSRCKRQWRHWRRGIRRTMKPRSSVLLCWTRPRCRKTRPTLTS